MTVLEAKNNPGLMHDGSARDFSKPARLENGYRYYLTQAEIDARDAEVEVEVVKQLEALPKRLRKDTTGTILTIDGVEYKCDIDTSMAVLGLIRMLEELNQADYTVPYKGVNGFYDRTLAQLKVAGLKIGDYQNKAFAAEKTTQEEVSDGIITTEAQLKTRFNQLMA